MKRETKRKILSLNLIIVLIAIEFVSILRLNLRSYEHASNESTKQLLDGNLDAPKNSTSQETFFKGQFLKSIKTPLSRLHCLSEIFRENQFDTPASLYRSCRYENLCYDIQTKNFVLFPSEQHSKLISTLHPSIFLSTMSKPVMVSAVRSSSPSETAKVTPIYLHNYTGGTFYTKTNDNQTIWIPIQPESCHSVFWDVYLPVFSLLELFDWQMMKPFQLLLLDNSNCTSDQLMEYADMFGLSSNQIVTTSQYSVFLSNESTKFVCFTNSLMGIGAHADHQIIRNITNLSIKEIRNIPPNHMRRTDNLRGFRELCVKNLKLVPERSIPFILAYSSIFTSSWIPSTVTEFEIVAISPEYSLREQIQITTKSAILILPASHDKTAAFFLPEGSSLILIGEPQADWDLWTNYAVIRVHLLSTITHKALEYLILDESQSLKSSTTFKEIESDSKSEPTSFANDRFVKLIEGHPSSTRVHCVGEKVFPNNLGAYQYRSCHFENLCFDLESKEFVMFPSAMNSILTKFDNESNDSGLYFSSVPRKLIGSPQPYRLSRNYMTFDYNMRSWSNATRYYRLEGVWLSKKTFNHCNLGHMLWDEWLPIFSLLRMFGLMREKRIVTKYPSIVACPSKHNEFEDLFGISSPSPEIELLSISHPKSNFVCVDHFLTGFGWLSDHGMNQHGWRPDDFKYPVNLRRGSELRRLRSFLLNNIGFPSEFRLEKPFLILFSINSSNDERRRIDFKEEVRALEQLSLQNETFTVMKLHLVEELSLKMQLELTSKTAIFISAVGGGTFPAFFLPKGASLILYGNRNMYLDFDIYNNHGQFRVHWMSLTKRKRDCNLLIDLIKDEIETIEALNSDR